MKQRLTNQNTIIRTNKRENPYVMIDKFGLNDERLSWKAKGLLAYLLSKPDNWQIYESDLIKRSKDGRDSIRSGLRELEKYGYMSRRQLRNEDGSFSAMEYVVYERPIISEEIESEIPADGKSVDGDEPQTENPSTGNPLTENPLLLNNDLNKNDLNMIDCSGEIAASSEIVEIIDQEPILNELNKYASDCMVQDNVSLQEVPEYISEIYVMLYNQYPNQLLPEIVKRACQLFSARAYEWNTFRMKINMKNPVGFFNVCYRDAVREYKATQNSRRKNKTTP